MIIYGYRSTLLGSKLVEDKCVKCNTENSVFISSYQKYAHIFWIPLFPIGRYKVSQCMHCQHVIENKIAMPMSYTAQGYKLDKELKTPKWTFAGLFIIAGLIITSIVIAKVDKGKEADMVAVPQKGDIYKIKKTDGNYTLYKVDSIGNDTIYVFANKYEATKLKGLTKLMSQGDTTYIEFPFPIPVKEITSMHEKGSIIEVIRK